MLNRDKRAQKCRIHQYKNYKAAVCRRSIRLLFLLLELLDTAYRRNRRLRLAESPKQGLLFSRDPSVAVALAASNFADAKAQRKAGEYISEGAFQVI